MSILDAALEWAENGVPVFPVGSNKAPLTKNGHKDASTDPDKVRSMFAGNPWGIGGAMGRESGLFAIDSDHYKPGESGDAAQRFVNMLIEKELLPETRTHTTKSGGRHYIYASDTDWPNCKPSDGVEVKGEGGYIVLPPSPGYAAERVGVADAPSGLLQLLKAAKKAAAMTPTNALKQKILSGEDFHDSLTLIAARSAASGALPEAVQADLLQLLQASVAASESHPRHKRWLALVNDKSGELSRIVFSGDSKFNPDTQSEALREAANGLFGVPQPRPHAMFSAPPAPEYDGNDWPYADTRGYFGHVELDDVLEQNFVAYPILVENEVTLISAEPKAGKTLVSQTLAMHVAAGIDLGEIKIFERRPVLYFALESQVAIKKRLRAWRKLHDPNDEFLTESTFPFYVSEMPLNLLEKAARTDMAKRACAADKWFQKEGAAPLGAIVIDTLTKAMPGGDQNSVEDTSAVFDVIQEIRSLGVRAPIIFIHHNKKDGGSPRGSSNIQAEPDTLLTLSKNATTSQLSLKIYMARSIEDDHDFLFDIKSVNLGKSSQGYDIEAPALVPAVVEKSVTDRVVDDLKLEIAYTDMFKALIAMGEGEHKLATVHNRFREQLPAALYDPVRKLYTSDPIYIDFITNIIPTTGRHYDNYSFMPIVKIKSRGVTKIEAIRVKKH